MANVFRLFGYWEYAKAAGDPAARPDSNTPAAYAEALFAGWVPPPPEIRYKAAPAAPANEEKSDITAFLDRVYLNQEC